MRSIVQSFWKRMFCLYFSWTKKKTDFNGILTSTSEDVLSKRIVEHVELV